MLSQILKSVSRIFIVSTGALLVLAAVSDYGLRKYGSARLAHAKAIFEAGHHELDLANYANPRIPENQNAGLWYSKSIELLVLGGDVRWQIARASITPHRQWTEETNRIVEESHRLNREALALFAYASLLPSSDFDVDYHAGLGSRIPATLDLINEARLVIALTRKDLAEDDAARGYTRMKQIKRLTETLESELNINMQYAGWTVESLLLRLIHELLPTSSPEATRTVASLMPDVDTASVIDRYMSWRIGSRINFDHLSDSNHGQQSTARPDDLSSWYKRRLEVAVHDLRSALQLEELHRELAQYSTCNCPLRADGSSFVDDPVFSELEPFIRRMTATRVSRLLIAQAIALKLDPTLPRSGNRSNDRGDSIVWRADDDGTILIRAVDAAAILSAFPARRENPAPPVEIRISAGGTWPAPRADGSNEQAWR